MIRFENVTKVYSKTDRPALDNVSIDIEKGEFVFLVGLSGSGKSTFLRLVLREERPTSGRIHVAGKDLGTLSNWKVPELRRQVGTVFQDFRLLPNKTVAENVAFTLHVLGFSKKEIAREVPEVLELVGLEDKADRKPGELSGGEQQRVAIAAAMVLHPKILVLDEPTSALDPVAAEEVLAILQRLVHDLGITVIIAEHRLERVIGYVDSVIEISADGKTRIGKPEEILKDSRIAPPIVKLARALRLPEISLSVRDLRKQTENIRMTGKDVFARQETLGRNYIEAKDLSVSYENKAALKPIDLEIKSGEIVALMGRNGAGKSSLIKALLEVVKYEGKISKRFVKIGYIPQDANDLLYHQSVEAECTQTDRDNSLAPGTTAALLHELAATVNIASHPRDLSEGQRLALVLAIVLAPKPDLLILDEPTRGLDYESKALLTKFLTERSESGAAVLIATHDVELVAELATRIIILAEGELVADGCTMDVLLASPSFAPQVTKVMSPRKWLTIADVLKAIE